MRYLVLLMIGWLLCACGGSDYAMAKSAPSPDRAYEESYEGAPAADEGESYGMAERSFLAQAPGAPPQEGPPAPPMPPGASTPPVVDAPSTDQPSKITEPLLIYTGTLHLAVFEAPKVVEGVNALAKEFGGYLVQRSDQQITIRVPSKRFHEALDKVASLGDVLSRDETVRDVTEEFFDMQTRLRNARAMRDRLEKLLAEAKNVEEALAVERELQRITESIELMEGKLKLLRELVAFSTITVHLKPRATDTVTPSVSLPFPWLDNLGLPGLMSM